MKHTPLLYLLRASVMDANFYLKFRHFMEEYPILDLDPVASLEYYTFDYEIDFLDKLKENESDDPSAADDYDDLYLDFVFQVAGQELEQFRRDNELLPDDVVFLMLYDERKRKGWLSFPVHATHRNFVVMTDMWTAYMRANETQPLSYEMASYFMFSEILKRNKELSEQHVEE